MAGLTSLMTAVSGLQAAQAGLYTIGHNISNTDTKGYVRQQVLQADFMSVTIGNNAVSPMQLGLGTTIAATRQIRDKFLDMSYRSETGRNGFYNAKYSAGAEIETIIGELQGEYKLQDVLQDMWKSLNDLKIDPTGIETRGMFITTAKTFIDKVNNVYERSFEYQRNLNDQVKSTVSKTNNLLIQIEKLNMLIADAESSGDSANDYRDRRNVCLDELSFIMKINYKEQKNGTVDIMSESGYDLLVNGIRSNIGLRYTASKCDFVEPVFTSSTEILPFDPTYQNARAVFGLTKDVNAANGNDNGKLIGLLVSRGLNPANYTDTPGSLTPGTREYFNVTNCLIPKAQTELDTLVHAVVTLINDTFAPYVPSGSGFAQDPNAPYGLDGSQHTPIFTRIAGAFKDRYDASGNLIEEDPAEPYSLYTIGNIQLNPILLSASGYNKIATSKSGDASDNRSILDGILTKWRGGFVGIDGEEKLNSDDFYSRIISRIGITTNEAKNFVETQEELLVGIDNKRKSISGVSSDEEMKNMLTYQHAYNASARIVSIIDNMLDKIINGTGRVGL